MEYDRESNISESKLKFLNVLLGVHGLQRSEETMCPVQDERNTSEPSGAAAIPDASSKQCPVHNVSSVQAAIPDASSKQCPVHNVSSVQSAIPDASSKQISSPDPPAAETAAKATDEASLKQRGGKPKGPSDADLTPEQLAKVEAKRKAKEEAAAEKALLKAAKKSGKSAYIPLGTGCAYVRDHLSSQLINSASFSFHNSVKMLAAYLHPFNTSEGGFAFICFLIIQHLKSSGARIRPKIPKGLLQTVLYLLKL